MKMPLMFELDSKKVLVIGGGNVGFRKSKKLLAYGAEVCCLSLEHLQAFDTLPTCQLIQGAYDPNYLVDQALVIAATSDPTVNHQILNDCKQRKLLCMVVNEEDASDVNFMATKKKEGITLAVSTDGQSPGFSKHLVQQLMDEVDSEEFQRLKLMSELRLLVINSSKTHDEKKVILSSFQSMSLEVLKDQYNIAKANIWRKNKWARN